jgi:hypothetical protein
MIYTNDVSYYLIGFIVGGLIEFAGILSTLVLNHLYILITRYHKRQSMNNPFKWKMNPYSPENMEFNIIILLK